MTRLRQAASDDRRRFRRMARGSALWHRFSEDDDSTPASGERRATKHGWTDGGKIEAKYTSRATELYWKLLSKEVAESATDENVLNSPKSPVAFSCKCYYEGICTSRSLRLSAPVTSSFPSCFEYVENMNSDDDNPNLDIAGLG